MDNTSAEQFFVVWNPAHGLPRHQHMTEEAAKNEAMRLASHNPGQDFYVLACVGKARRVDPVEWKATDWSPF